LKFRIEVEGEIYTLDLRRNADQAEYTLQGLSTLQGSASVLQVMPGVFSVLLGPRSFTVQVLANRDEMQVWIGNQRRVILLADVRDRAPQNRKASLTGPVEIRSQMPGKVVRVLVRSGDPVQAGQGVIVVEAMKMQNEMKSPKDGTVKKIHVEEGATVAAGESLVVIE
jgi:biotin carboxyl carrier protein